ncbi:Methyltransferase type 11 [Leptothrix cholodnii SP-6]|uniref:Methyltransferase type 11 n=1 Tax=Leptothrix cholodnii (strain ATCC 51168 / LMG 8142 / SP-6) TaxID=395495 RepID=B1XW46_LEPCP|nr:class I SAM-dependent methyltransferase [Leptothrix cholodnii]ACB32573.1 Methyltransferase type 11 [Leptothrix cholodnii SP-6]
MSQRTPSPRPAPGSAARPLTAGGDLREIDAVAQRYERREAVAQALAASETLDRYSLLRPDVWQTVQERQRVMLQMLAARGWFDLASRRLVEVGCGAGGNLLEFLRMGFVPQHLTGLELLRPRYAQARQVLPQQLRLHLGDAQRAPIAEESIDLVFQATVFSSLLDDAYQQQLADTMWRWVKPGGAVLWYDFTVDNPRNPDVRGVPLARVRALFPGARVEARRVTLAPPIARGICRLHPSLYRLFNSLPLLRTHMLVWLGKPAN